MKPFKKREKPEPKAPSQLVVTPMAEPEPIVDKPAVALHNCTSRNQHGGYGHLVTACFEDLKGHLWLVGSTGRLMSMVNWCPFCGFRALNEAEELVSVNATEDQLTTPTDRPNRVWKNFTEAITMHHFLFGSVSVYASDGCHAKVKCDMHKGYITVCVENLAGLGHIEYPVLPKVMRKEKEKPTKKSHEEKVAEMVNKYAGLV